MSSERTPAIQKAGEHEGEDSGGQRRRAFTNRVDEGELGGEMAGSWSKEGLHLQTIAIKLSIFSTREIMDRLQEE